MKIWMQVHVGATYGFIDLKNVIGFVENNGETRVLMNDERLIIVKESAKELEDRLFTLIGAAYRGDNHD